MEESKGFSVVDRRGQEKPKPDVRSEETSRIERRVSGPDGQPFSAVFEVGKKWPVDQYGLAINKNNQAVGLLALDGVSPSPVSGPFSRIIISNAAFNVLMAQRNEEQSAYDRSQSRNAQRRADEQRQAQEGSEEKEGTNK